jgi:hypothetical protein
MRLESDDYLYLIDVEAEKRTKDMRRSEELAEHLQHGLVQDFGQYLTYRRQSRKNVCRIRFTWRWLQDIYAEHVTNQHIQKNWLQRMAEIDIFD